MIRTRTLCSIPMLLSALAACGAQAPLDPVSDVAPNATPATPRALSVELLPLSEGSGALEYRLTNDSDTSLRFLPWDTALVGIGSNQFDVRQNDRAVSYVG